MLAISTAAIEPEGPEVGALIEKARAGDAEVFCEICRLYESRLLRQAFTLCGNGSMAEDLAQETLLEAWKSLRRFQGRCQFFTWLCAILLNRYRNAVRQKRPLPISALARGDEEKFTLHIEQARDAEVTPDRFAEIQEEARLMLACIQALPAKHQEIVYLRFYVNHSLDEIAASLGCSLGTVKSRLFRALEKLRTMNALQGRLTNSEKPIGGL